jgi:hypothetical protein
MKKEEHNIKRKLNRREKNLKYQNQKETSQKIKKEEANELS